MSRVLQAVIFDMDGLLVDTEPLWFEVEAIVMARLGNTWSHEDQAGLLGGSMQTTVAYLLARADPSIAASATPDVVEGWLVEEMLTALRHGVPMRPGARDLLSAVGAAGLPAALVSASYRVLVDAVLDVVGRDRFAVSVAGDEVSQPKPHPEGYLRAATLLGIETGCGIVLEDSENGVRAGVAAGFLTVGVASVSPLAPGPGRVLRDSLIGLTVDSLSDLLAARAAAG